MQNKKIYIALGVIGLAIASLLFVILKTTDRIEPTDFVVGGPSYRLERSIHPEADSAYTFGTSTRRWLQIFTDGASTTRLTIDGITSKCLQTDANGNVEGASGLCGSGGGGSTSKWATTTNEVAIYPNGGATVGVVIGATATTTDSKLEVTGNTRLNGTLSVAGTSSFEDTLSVPAGSDGAPKFKIGGYSLYSSASGGSQGNGGVTIQDTPAFGKVWRFTDQILSYVDGDQTHPQYSHHSQQGTGMAIHNSTVSGDPFPDAPVLSLNTGSGRRININNSEISFNPRYTAGYDFTVYGFTSTSTFGGPLWASTTAKFAGEISATGTAPTISSCGSTPDGSVVGNDTTGRVTVGGGAPTSCTITYAKPKKGITHVFVQVEGATALGTSISSQSATAFTATFGAALGGGSFSYWVISD